MTARILGVAAVLALIATACGGSTEPTQSAPESTATSTATAQHAPSDTPATEATATTLPPRTDGLDGAPVPPPQAVSAEFDADRFNAAGGAFPPLDDPVHILPHEADWLSPDSLVLGAIQNGEARAYPIGMMTLHHVSNDTLGGEPYLVTF